MPVAPPDEPGGAGEHLVRSGDVERLHAVVGDDHDAAGGGHDVRVCGGDADGVKDMHPTVPAITVSERPRDSVARPLSDPGWP